MLLLIMLKAYRFPEHERIKENYSENFGGENFCQNKTKQNKTRIIEDLTLHGQDDSTKYKQFIT